MHASDYLEWRQGVGVSREVAIMNLRPEAELWAGIERDLHLLLEPRRHLDELQSEAGRPRGRPLVEIHCKLCAAKHNRVIGRVLNVGGPVFTATIDLTRAGDARTVFEFDRMAQLFAMREFHPAVVLATLDRTLLGPLFGSESSDREGDTLEGRELDDTYAQLVPVSFLRGEESWKPDLWVGCEHHGEYRLEMADATEVLRLTDLAVGTGGRQHTSV